MKEVTFAKTVMIIMIIFGVWFLWGVCYVLTHSPRGY